MINVQNILVTLSAYAVTFLVPAVVWITLTAGLLHLVVTGVQRLGGLPSGSHKLAQRSSHS